MKLPSIFGCPDYIDHLVPSKILRPSVLPLDDKIPVIERMHPPLQDILPDLKTSIDKVAEKYGILPAREVGKAHHHYGFSVVLQ